MNDGFIIFPDDPISLLKLIMKCFLHIHFTFKILRAHFLCGIITYNDTEHVQVQKTSEPIESSTIKNFCQSPL